MTVMVHLPLLWPFHPLCLSLSLSLSLTLSFRADNTKHTAANPDTIVFCLLTAYLLCLLTLFSLPLFFLPLATERKLSQRRWKAGKAVFPSSDDPPLQLLLFADMSRVWMSTSHFVLSDGNWYVRLSAWLIRRREPALAACHRRIEEEKPLISFGLPRLCVCVSLSRVVHNARECWEIVGQYPL